jgi:N-acetylglucosaminyldiphosphoundecaprenol N-acetyl-beta-D-mannosaminyltransferase
VDHGELATRIDLFGLPLDIGVTESDVVQRLTDGLLRLTYLNPLAFRIAAEFPEYSENLARFDMVVCDGIGVQKAAKRLYGRSTPILTPDLSGIGRAYLQFGAARGLALCLVGARPGVSDAAARTIDSSFSGYSSIVAFDGYGDSPERAKKHMLDSATDMVLVGLGMGRQEAWLLDLAGTGWQGIGICVGGFLDKLAHPDLDYPAWSERLNLRFLGRLLQEPRRMSKRYFFDYQPFIRHYLKALLS